MDYGGHPGFSGSNVVQRPHESIGSSNDKWTPGLNDQSIWATEDEYGVWNGDSYLDNQSNSTYESGQLQSRSGSEPPNKKSRSFIGDSQGNVLNRDREISNRNKALGKMFYKTKLCCKFREGTCPYTTNCNFAHGIEELRQPPPNWQEIIASQGEDRDQPREERQIPSLSSSGVGVETQRNYKGRHCKKFYTEEGCPYGDSCTFLHDEQSRSRESVAISLGPTFGSGFGSPGNGPSQKPSNWKTRICNKWEMTGYCPFGGKCHFAHGLAELHKYGGGLVDTETRDPSLSSSDVQPVGPSTKAPTDTFPISNTTSVPHSDVHYLGVSSQRSANLNQRQGQRALQKWKGPDKISRIYGDWIDDDDYS